MLEWEFHTFSSQPALHGWLPDALRSERRSCPSLSNATYQLVIRLGHIFTRPPPSLVALGKPVPQSRCRLDSGRRQRDIVRSNSRGDMRPFGVLRPDME